MMGRGQPGCYPYVESTGAPVGQVSWISDANELMLAADIVTEMQVRVYAPDRDLPAEDQRRLMLLTVAVSWWQHATRSAEVEMSKP